MTTVVEVNNLHDRKPVRHSNFKENDNWPDWFWTYLIAFSFHAIFRNYSITHLFLPLTDPLYNLRPLKVPYPSNQNTTIFILLNVSCNILVRTEIIMRVFFHHIPHLLRLSLIRIKFYHNRFNLNIAKQFNHRSIERPISNKQCRVSDRSVQKSPATKTATGLHHKFDDFVLERFEFHSRLLSFCNQTVFNSSELIALTYLNFQPFSHDTLLAS